MGLFLALLFLRSDLRVHREEIGLVGNTIVYIFIALLAFPILLISGSIFLIKVFFPKIDPQVRVGIAFGVYIVIGLIVLSFSMSGKLELAQTLIFYPVIIIKNYGVNLIK